MNQAILPDTSAHPAVLTAGYNPVVSEDYVSLGSSTTSIEDPQNLPLDLDDLALIPEVDFI